MLKNVLIFSHNYNNPFFDVTNQYIHCFDQSKYEITVVYLFGEPNELIKQKHGVKSVIFLNTQKKKRFKIGLIKKIKALCAEKKFEIIICHRYKPSYLVFWTAVFVNIPHIFFVMHELGTFNHFFRKLSAALFYKKNMRFVGVSQAVREDLIKSIWRVPKKNIISLPNTINVNETNACLVNRAQARKHLNLTADSFVFGTIGRLVENKDQQTLIRAFSQIQQYCSHALLIIIGEGRLAEPLKKLTHELNISDKVILTGYMANARDFLKAFDVFISTSTQEAFGRVLLEAMVAEVPIIATQVHGIPEVLADTGRLIPPQRPDILANEMIKSYQLSSTELNKWGKLEGERVKEYFSFEQFNNQFWQEVQNEINFRC